jgi:PAS domain-containing protein
MNMSLIDRLFYYKGTPLDIDESKESLQELERLTEELNARPIKTASAEKMLRTATDDIESPMWGKDLDGRFVFLNKACAKKLLKTTVQDALNQTDDDFDSDALSQVCMNSDRIVEATMATHRQIEHARYPDGMDLWLDTTKSPWIVDDKLVGTVGIGREITSMVPEDVRDEYPNPGCVKIPTNLMYNSLDIRELMK